MFILAYLSSLTFALLLNKSLHPRFLPDASVLMTSLLAWSLLNLHKSYWFPWCCCSSAMLNLCIFLNCLSAHIEGSGFVTAALTPRFSRNVEIISWLFSQWRSQVWENNWWLDFSSDHPSPQSTSWVSALDFQLNTLFLSHFNSPQHLNVKTSFGKSWCSPLSL